MTTAQRGFSGKVHSRAKGKPWTKMSVSSPKSVYPIRRFLSISCICLRNSLIDTIFSFLQGEQRPTVPEQQLDGLLTCDEMNVE